MTGHPVIIDAKHHNDWIVPRRVMCAFFWIGIILLFTGIILLVTSKHKGAVYQSWGAVLLGLGFCLLLICLILCLHAYCVITITDEELPIKSNIPPPPPPSTLNHSASDLGDTDSRRGGRSLDRNDSPVVMFDLGPANSEPHTPDILDDEPDRGRVTIISPAGAAAAPLANGDLARRKKTAQNSASSLTQNPTSSSLGSTSSWRTASGRSLKNVTEKQKAEDTKSSHVGSPYYVEDPASRVQTPFGSSHALTPLHMIDAENPAPKPSTSSKYPPEVYDGSYYQGMAPYDNAVLVAPHEHAASVTVNKYDMPYDNCDRPAVADAAELIRARAQEAASGIYEGTSSLRGTPSSLRRTPGTPGSRRSTPASPRGTPVSARGTPANPRGRSASPRGTPGSQADSGSATPGSTSGTPVSVLAVEDVTNTVSPSVEEVSNSEDINVNDRLGKPQTQDSTEGEPENIIPNSVPTGSSGMPRRGGLANRLVRQVTIPETAQLDSFDDEELEFTLPQVRPAVPPSKTGPIPVMSSRGPYFLPPGYKPLAAMSPPRSAFTSVPPRDMRVFHPRPQRFSPSGEPVLSMRPPYGVAGEPKRFSQPVVVYLNPNMQQSDSKISIYDNVQYVWSDQNPHHYQPYTQGDKTYCDV